MKGTNTSYLYDFKYPWSYIKKKKKKTKLALVLTQNIQNIIISTHNQHF